MDTISLASAQTHNQLLHQGYLQYAVMAVVGFVFVGYLLARRSG